MAWNFQWSLCCYPFMKVLKPVEFCDSFIDVPNTVLEVTLNVVQRPTFPLIHVGLDWLPKVVELINNLLLIFVQKILHYLLLHPSYLARDDFLQFRIGHCVCDLNAPALGLVAFYVVLKDGLLTHWAVSEDNWDFLLELGGSFWIVEVYHYLWLPSSLDGKLVLDDWPWDLSHHFLSW